MRKAIYVAMTAALLLASCKGKEEPVPEKVAAPVLKSTTPADGASGIEYGDLRITLAFDQNVSCPTGTRSGITVSPTAAFDSFDAHDKALYITLKDLAGNTAYTLTFPSGTILGLKENQEVMQQIKLSFTTKEKPADPSEVPERGSSIAWKMQEELGLGFNFGNNLDAYRNGSWAGELQDVPDETCWGCDKITLAAMQKLKSYGFRSVRIPISWLKKIGPAPDYKIDAEWMARVAEIVDYAQQTGLWCIINTHHDENHRAEGSNTPAHWQDILGALNSREKNDSIKAEMKAVWTQIAVQFKDKGEFLIFEPFNEINDGGWGWSSTFKANPQAQYDILNSWLQVFVDAVRATGGNNATRWLGLPGYCASPEFTLAGLVLPKDSAEGRLMVAVHSYDPFNFNNHDAYYKPEWGHTASPSKRCSSDDEKAMRTMMGNLYLKYVKNGIPCYFGEFGSINRPTDRERSFERYWFEYFTKCARSYGMGAFLWDNQSLDDYSMGYIHHGTGDYIREGKTMVSAMLKGMNTTDSSYTLETVYNNAPK